MLNKLTNFFKKLLSKKKEEGMKKYVPEFSFCETIYAHKWHIRKLTEKGKKLSGGADTQSLCGTNIAWDIKCKLPDKEFIPLQYNLCNPCYIIYFQILKEKRNQICSG